MMKLMLFAPCEKLIIGKDNHSSLITVLEHIQLDIKAGAEIPNDAAAPYRWTVISLFHRDFEIDKPTDYETKVELISPSGKANMGGTTVFNVTNEHYNFRNLLDFPVMPVEAGIHKLMLYLKKMEEENWEQVGEYPIRVVHNFVEVEDENKNEVESEQPVEVAN